MQSENTPTVQGGGVNGYLRAGRDDLSNLAPDDKAPSIQIRRDGAFWRVVVEPETALPSGWSRPSTFSSQPLAAMSAKLLADASGLPIVDQAKAG